MILRFVLTVVALLAALPARADVDIQEVTSPGGLTAWLVEDHSIPFTALELRFDGGASLDEPGKRGATYLMTGLLEEGTGDMDSRAFARAVDSLAASFDYDAYDDTASISARFLTDNQDEALALLKGSLVNPSFPEEAVERVRQQVLSIIRQDLKDPGEIAGTAMDRLAYGDHPYGSPRTGTLDSVAALTREDMVTAHRNLFARDRVTIGAVGDITPEELGAVLDDLLGELPETGAPLPGRAELQVTPGVTIVPYDTPQAEAIWGHSGIDVADDDFFAAYILNTILGGGSFESRLMQEVREARGLTYGVYSWLSDGDYAEMWKGAMASANDRVAEAIDVVRTEWARISEDGVTEKELEDAKKYITGAYPLRFDGNGRIAGILVGMQRQGFPIDYADTRNDRVNAVTLDDVNRVASEYLDADALRFVVVGQPEGLEAVN